MTAIDYALLALAALSFIAGHELGFRIERRRWRDLITQAWYEDLISDHAFTVLRNHWSPDRRTTLFDMAQAQTAKRAYRRRVAQDGEGAL